MTVSIRQTHPIFVGEVSGCDLTEPLVRDEVAAFEAGMDRYAVLVVRDQRITDEQQLAFTRNFGEIEIAHGGHITTRPEEKRLGARRFASPPRPLSNRAPSCLRWKRLAARQGVRPLSPAVGRVEDECAPVVRRNGSNRPASADRGQPP
jgi:Taurine catabolism dioxygenase TauD, TfdA family